MVLPLGAVNKNFGAYISDGTMIEKFYLIFFLIWVLVEELTHITPASV